MFGLFCVFDFINLYGSSEASADERGLLRRRQRSTQSVPIGLSVLPNSIVRMAGRGSAACCVWGDGRALHRGCGACARLSGSSRTDGGAGSLRTVWPRCGSRTNWNLGGIVALAG